MMSIQVIILWQQMWTLIFFFYAICHGYYEVDYTFTFYV